MVIVEIWMAGVKEPIYEFEAKRIDASIDGTFVRITSTADTVYQVSPHNVIIREYPKKGDG